MEQIMPAAILSTLQFSSLKELVEFQMITGKYRSIIDDKQLTITCSFTEAEIELAREGYKATAEISRGKAN